jgi:MFS family permease
MTTFRRVLDGPCTERATAGDRSCDEVRPSLQQQEAVRPTVFMKGCRFLRENRILIMRVFLPFVAGYYLSYLFRTINGLVAAPLTSDLGLTAGDLGLLTSAFFLTFAAAQIPVGVLLDRYGPRRVQSVLLIAAASGAAVFAASDDFYLLLAARALMGLGVAGALNAGLKALIAWFPGEQLPLLNGFMVMLGALGAVTATLPADLLLASIGWRGMFALFAAATACCAAAIWLVVPDTTKSATGPGTAALHEVYTDRRFWRVVPLSAMTIGTAWALQGLWAAQWLTDVEGLDRARWFGICSSWPPRSARARCYGGWLPTGFADAASVRRPFSGSSPRSLSLRSSHWFYDGHCRDTSCGPRSRRSAPRRFSVTRFSPSSFRKSLPGEPTRFSTSFLSGRRSRCRPESVSCCNSGRLTAGIIRKLPTRPRSLSMSACRSRPVSGSHFPGSYESWRGPRARL